MVSSKAAPVFDVAVVGGGIVGIATAMILTEEVPGLKLVVLEKETALARHQTGHNSGVIHSGLYYRPGSLKARNCVEGRKALCRFCAEKKVPHEQCGKVVVATRERELPALEALELRGRENGLEGVERLDEKGIREHEPEVDGIAGLWVPQTGIVDFIRVTEAFARVARAQGAEIRTSSKVHGVDRGGGEITLRISSGVVKSRFLINCAGLQCDRIARLCGVDPGVRIIPFRGEYYKLIAKRRGLVRNLVYPVPDPALPFLGVHFTRMIDGGVEAGPNAVLAFKREGYDRTDFSLCDTLEILSFQGFWRMAWKFWATGLEEYRRSFSREAFLRDLQRLVPALESEDIVPAAAGVRAQAVAADGRLLDDFHIVEGEGMIHLLNAPSPAATAAISIGRSLSERARKSFRLG